MNSERTAQTLTHDDFLQAVAQAGGPRVVKRAFEELKSANERLHTEYSRILEQYPRQWIAFGPDGLIANVPVPEDSTAEEQKQALEKLVGLVRQSERSKDGYLIRYIDPEEGVMIL